jgi:hypothetical protein
MAKTPQTVPTSSVWFRPFRMMQRVHGATGNEMAEVMNRQYAPGHYQLDPVAARFGYKCVSELYDDGLLHFRVVQPSRGTPAKVKKTPAKVRADAKRAADGMAESRMKTVNPSTIARNAAKVAKVAPKGSAKVAKVAPAKVAKVAKVTKG